MNKTKRKIESEKYFEKQKFTIESILRKKCSLTGVVKQVKWKLFSFILKLNKKPK